MWHSERTRFGQKTRKCRSRSSYCRPRIHLWTDKLNHILTYLLTTNVCIFVDWFVLLHLRVISTGISTMSPSLLSLIRYPLVFVETHRRKLPILRKIRVPWCLFHIFVGSCTMFTPDNLSDCFYVTLTRTLPAYVGPMLSGTYGTTPPQSHRIPHPRSRPTGWWCMNGGLDSFWTIGDTEKE